MFSFYAPSPSPENNKNQKFSVVSWAYEMGTFARNGKIKKGKIENRILDKIMKN